MNTNQSAQQLILNNLKLFNDAATLLATDMTNTLNDAFNHHLENFKKNNAWIVCNESETIGDIWLFPKIWNKTPSNARKPRSLAYFYIESIEPSTEIYLWPTQFCGVSKDGEAGFKLEINKQFVDATKWNEWCTNIPSDIISELDKFGFEYRKDDNCEGIFAPIRLDLEALSHTWDSGSDEIAKNIQSFSKLLNDLPKVANILDQHLVSCLFK